MKIVRYVLFCILILILSIYLRRPADMPKTEWGIVERVTSFFSQDDEKSDEGSSADREEDDEEEKDEDG